MERMNVTTTPPPRRSIAAELYEAAVEADPEQFEDLAWDLLEPAKQAPWIAIANRAERLFQEGHLPTTPDLGSDPAELARALGVYFDAASVAAQRILPPGAPAVQAGVRLAEAGFWAARALGVG